MYKIYYCKLDVVISDDYNEIFEKREVYKPMLFKVNKKSKDLMYVDYYKIQLHRFLLPPKSKLKINFNLTVLSELEGGINYDPKKDGRNKYNYNDFLNSINRKKGKGGKNVKSKKGKASKGKASKGKADERLFE